MDFEITASIDWFSLGTEIEQQAHLSSVMVVIEGLLHNPKTSKRICDAIEIQLEQYKERG